MKKLLAVILCLTLLTGTFSFASLSANAYSNVAEYPDFDMDCYIAGLYVEPDSPNEKCINFKLDNEFLSDKILRDLSDEDFLAAVTAWEMLTLKASDATETGVNEIGYYEAIILSILNSTYSNDSIKNSFDNQYIKNSKNIFSNFKNILELNYAITFDPNLDINNAPLNIQQDYIDAFGKSFKETFPNVNVISTYIKYFTAIVKAGRSVEESINNLCSYYMCYDLNEYMKAVITDLYNNCDSSNIYMKKALENIKKSSDSYEVAFDSAAFDFTIKEFSVAYGLVMDGLVDKFIASSPAGLAFVLGRDIGKGISNLLFSTDAICEQFYKMQAMKNIEDLVKKVARIEINNFKSDKTHYNANKLFNAVDILFESYNASADLCIEYADIIFEKSIAGVFVLNKYGYNDFLKSIKILKRYNTDDLDNLKSSYVFYLEEDYPEIYEALMEEEDNLDYVPVTKIEFKNQSVEWGLQDTWLGGDEIVINPENATCASVSYTSSDPSVVTWETTGPKVHKAGSAVITATSNSSGLTAELNVTVVEGHGKNGVYFEPTTPTTNTEAFGKCGDNLEWKLYYTGTLEISGSGSMYDFDSTSFPWYYNRSSIKRAYVDYGVTSIGECAFYNCKSLTSVTISDSVTSIGLDAFICCESLTSVAIPDSVIMIDAWAFSFCPVLTSVTIGNSVTSVNDCAFAYCKSLTSVTIPNSVLSIGISAFKDCTSLTSVTIPDSVTCIGDRAFDNCTSLKDVYYNGTQEQWNQIDIGYYNSSLKSATIHFNNDYEEPSTDPTEPTNPSIPTDPISPTNPVNPTEPTNPTDPIISTQPTTLDPTEQTSESPSSPIEPTQPSTSNNSTQPTTSSQSVTNSTATQPTTAKPTVKPTGSTTVTQPTKTTTKSANQVYTKPIGPKPAVNSTTKATTTTANVENVTVKAPKLTAGKKQFKVQYKKVKNAEGFQVRYKTGKGKWKLKTFNTKKSATKTIKGLKKGKYKVQIRIFTKGKKLYSKWSKTKTVKVK